MRRSDWFFFGCMAAYLVIGIIAIATKIAPIEFVQLVWLAVMAAPLFWPWFGRKVGIRPLWQHDA